MTDLTKEEREVCEKYKKRLAKEVLECYDKNGLKSGITIDFIKSLVEAYEIMAIASETGKFCATDQEIKFGRRLYEAKMYKKYKDLKIGGIFINK